MRQLCTNDKTPEEQALWDLYYMSSTDALNELIQNYTESQQRKIRNVAQRILQLQKELDQLIDKQNSIKPGPERKKLQEKLDIHNDIIKQCSKLLRNELLFAKHDALKTESDQKQKAADESAFPADTDYQHQEAK